VEDSGIYIIVSDPKVPSIDAQSIALDWKNRKYTARLIKNNGTDKLLWYIERLPHKGSVSLQYSLPSSMLKVTTNAPESLKITEGIPKQESISSKNKNSIDYDFSISIEKSDGVDATLEVIDSRISLPRVPRIGYVAFDGKEKVTRLPQKLSKPDRYLWKLGPLANKKVVVLQYSID